MAKARGTEHWNFLHGKSGTPLHHVWLTMRQRCRNPRSKRFPLYGERGITICEEWDDFAAFESWARDNGYEPGLSLDRIDNDGPYGPDNCRWVTQAAQNRNTRRAHLVTYRGRTQSLADWADELGVNYHTLRSRLRIGWSPEKALETPFRGES